jgi:hypothetical protein
MSHWDDLSLHVGAHYRVVKREAHWIGVEIPLEAENVRIKLERVTAFEKSWVLVIAAICSETHVDAMAALRYNAFIAVGALVLENERCYLRAALSLDGLTTSALERAINFIARESLKLRRQFSPRGEVPEFLGMFGE